MERLKELAGKIAASHGPCAPAQDRDCHLGTQGSRENFHTEMHSDLTIACDGCYHEDDR